MATCLRDEAAAGVDELGTCSASSGAEDGPHIVGSCAAVVLTQRQRVRGVLVEQALDLGGGVQRPAGAQPREALAAAKHGEGPAAAEAGSGRRGGVEVRLQAAAATAAAMAAARALLAGWLNAARPVQISAREKRVQGRLCETTGCA